jgi:hypothetical protein
MACFIKHVLLTVQFGALWCLKYGNCHAFPVVEVSVAFKYFIETGLLALCSNPNPEDQVSIFISPGDWVAQLYPQAPSTHFSRLLRHAWATVGLFFSPVTTRGGGGNTTGTPYFSQFPKLFYLKLYVSFPLILLMSLLLCLHPTECRWMYFSLFFVSYNQNIRFIIGVQSVVIPVVNKIIIIINNPVFALQINSCCPKECTKCLTINICRCTYPVSILPL